MLALHRPPTNGNNPVSNTMLAFMLSVHLLAALRKRHAEAPVPEEVMSHDQSRTANVFYGSRFH